MGLAKIGSALPIDEKPATRASSAKLVDFIAFQARKRRIKEVQNATGLSVKAIENMRMGLSGASALTITTWCQNDDDFRDAYFHYCGGIDPQTYRGLTLAVHAYLQRQKPGLGGV